MKRLLICLLLPFALQAQSPVKLVGLLQNETIGQRFAQPGSFNTSISAPSALLDSKTPQASWIWDSGEDNPVNYYLMVRKTFDLERVPAEAKAFISAFSYADVYINGVLLDRCPMNCDPEFQVYEQFDISDYFHQGENTISALVYNFGTGTHHRMDARGGFFFQGYLKFTDNKILKINSDSSWKVCKAAGWDNHSELRAPGANLIGFVEDYDARKMPEGWKNSPFDDSKWQSANMLGVPPLAPWNHIVEVKRPPLFREKINPVRHWTVDNKVIYDFEKEVTGNPIIVLFAREPGTRLEMGTSERLLPDSTILYKERVNYTDYYTCKEGKQVWSPLTWRGFRYLSITPGDSIVIKNVSVINRHYTFRDEGSFECSDPLLNRIYDAGVFSLKLCAQDTYEDTPWREQTQYIAGDSRYLQKYAFYPFGLSSEFLIRYNILSGAWSQRWSPDGAIRSRYPTGCLLGPNTSVYLFDYELEYVIMLGEYDRYFGGTGLLQQVYPNLVKLMAYFDKFINPEHGLLAKVPGWVVLDHPDTYPMDQKDEITGINCLYYEALKQAACIAKTVNNDPHQASVWEKQAETLKKNIRKWLWSPEDHLYHDSFGSEKCSQQTQVYAMLYGLVDTTEKPAMVEKVAALNRNSEQSFSYYLLYSMFDTKPLWSLEYIRKYWGAQMKLPLFNGGWHEAWEIEKWPNEIATTSHAWSSGPTALLPQKVLGVEPVSEGWEKFSVRPNPCDLKWARGTVSTPSGAIRVEWKIDDQGVFDLHILVPENTSAEIAIPGDTAQKIRINGKPADNVNCQDGRMVFQAAPGEYEIVTTR
ncbi:MAG: family 78 glycoside hydrolase catalytic domain [Bacteroidales bacterium]|nr:family 78 glycoside hydrolase catalytic domain [Bacteroidales bacterium]